VPPECRSLFQPFRRKRSSTRCFLLPSDALSRLAKKREREKGLGKKNECVHLECETLNDLIVDVKTKCGELDVTIAPAPNRVRR